MPLSHFVRELTLPSPCVLKSILYVCIFIPAQVLWIDKVYTRAASAPPGYLLEMHICRPYLRLSQSEMFGVGPSICVLRSPPGGF